jgi:hypothetical protein
VASVKAAKNFVRPETQVIAECGTTYFQVIGSGFF